MLENENTTWVFFLHKHSKFWTIFLGQKVEQNPLFSEEWFVYHVRFLSRVFYSPAITSVQWMNYLLCVCISKKVWNTEKDRKNTRLYQATKTRPTFSKVQEKLHVVNISAGFLEIASKVKKTLRLQLYLLSIFCLLLRKCLSQNIFILFLRSYQ